MSRALNLFVVAGMAVMTVVFAAFCWTYWDAISHFGALAHDKQRLLRGALFGAAFCPVWLGLCTLFLNRQMRQRDLHFAPEHRRFYGASMVVGVLATAAMQAWITFGATYVPLAGKGVFLRGVLVFWGVFVMVYGNFHAKVPPASGARAPAPAVWIRGMLRNGWAMVLLGLAQVVLAILLPLKLLPVLTLGMVLAAVPIWRSQFRLMWARGKPQPHA